MAKRNAVFPHSELSQAVGQLTPAGAATATKNYQQWQANPAHPSLEFKRINANQNIWSVRVGIGWRALGIVNAAEDKIIWFWIGSHTEYDRILKQQG